MPVHIGLDITLERPPDVMARKFSDMTKAGMGKLALRWNDKYLPLHFKPGAAQRYGYQPRKPSTNQRKRRAAAKGLAKQGGRLPLVHSGNLEAAMARGGVLRVFPSRVTLTKPAGPYLTDRPRNGRPNMMRELAALHPSEKTKLAEVFERVVMREMAKFRRRKKLK